MQTIRMLPCALLALFVTTGAAHGAATCAELLVRMPERTYLCTATNDDGDTVTVPITFRAHPTGAATEFRASLVYASEWTCACDAQGSARRPRFHAARSFACLFEGQAQLLRGKVAGRDGERIAHFSVWTSGGGALGSCVLQ
jgi:hypothetical protein